MMRLAVPVPLGEALAPPPAEPRAHADGDDSLFSIMHYRLHCGAGSPHTGTEVRVRVEPLQGINRDPLTICNFFYGRPLQQQFTMEPDEDEVQSKRMLLAAPAAPVSLSGGPWHFPANRLLTANTAHSGDERRNWQVAGAMHSALGARCAQAFAMGRDQPCRARTVLLDLGASTFSGWTAEDDQPQPTALGAAWFVDRYRRLGVEFDTILAFEADPQSSSAIWGGVPAKLVPRLVYVNQPVSANTSSPYHPFRYLEQFGVTVEDFVVVKLDIDTPHIENTLVEQLLDGQSNWHALIDELYYEHHTTTAAMSGGWKFGEDDPKPTMADTYRIFTSLRRKGIRMHSWP